MDPKRLREATRAEHEATEAAVPLLQPGLTRAQYVRVLRCFYPVVGGWETWSAQHAPPELREFVAARGRSALLRNDLRFFAPDASEPTAAPHAFEAARIPGLSPVAPDAGQDQLFKAAFLGAMYVMEGSTLGGQYIARQVEEELGLQHGEGNAFFLGYGAQTGAMWKQFQAQIAAVPEERGEVVITAAKAMFAFFAESMSACTCA